MTKTICWFPWSTSGYTWPHRCNLEVGHAGLHRCRCGEQS